VANGGNLEALMKWLQMHDPPWDETRGSKKPCIKADKGGNL